MQITEGRELNEQAQSAEDEGDRTRRDCQVIRESVGVETSDSSDAYQQTFEAQDKEERGQGASLFHPSSYPDEVIRRDRQLRDHPHQMQEAFDHKPRPEVKTDSLESGVNEGVRERVKGPLDV